MSFLGRRLPGVHAVKRPVTPWSADYWEARNQYLRATCASPALLDAFRSANALPLGHGAGFDERCVEYPWLLAQLSDEHQDLLDVGSALNHEHLLTHAALKDRRITIVTLGPETECFWKLGISYLFDDARSLPFRDGIYDAVTCVSTLEHVGFDNSFYGESAAAPESSDGDYGIVMREMSRVLKGGGSMFLTVPFGRHRRFAEFQQFDRTVLASAIEAFGPARNVVETFYLYSAQGWQVADADRCRDAEYVEWITRPRDQWPDPLPVEPDLAAAARAVACVRLTKA